MVRDSPAEIALAQTVGVHPVDHLAARIGVQRLQRTEAHAAEELIQRHVHPEIGEMLAAQQPCQTAGLGILVGELLAGHLSRVAPDALAVHLVGDDRAHGAAIFPVGPGVARGQKLHKRAIVSLPLLALHVEGAQERVLRVPFVARMNRLFQERRLLRAVEHPGRIQQNHRDQKAVFVHFAHVAVQPVDLLLQKMIDPAVGHEVDDLGVARLHRQQRRQIDVDERLGQPQLLHVLQTAVQRLDALRLWIRFVVDAASVKQIGNIHRAAQSRLEPARLQSPPQKKSARPKKP